MAWDGMLVLETGEIAGNASATQMPGKKCMLVNFKAQSDNACKVYIGVTSGVTTAGGTEDTTTGWQLGSGEETGFIPCNNINNFYRICDNAGDDLIYIAIG